MTYTVRDSDSPTGAPALANKKPKNQRSKRTSMWLDNGLRAQLDKRATAEGRSLAQTIEFYLRKGLGLRATVQKTQPGESDAPIFG
ncbi:MAG: hypothetical protein PS018_11615 [bacterium]|nr:hypothetical protein [bacterium]